MPLHQLAVAPVDVNGARLALTLNAPAPAPLASCQLDHPDGGALLLGVLGASHVVVVEGHFSEQVSCAPRSPDARDAGLPEHTEVPGYHLEARTEEHDEATFRQLAQRLREQCTAESGWLGGMFPGDDAALTALAAEPDCHGWRWQTWHLYPACPAGSGGTVVHTASRWRP